MLSLQRSTTRASPVRQFAFSSSSRPARRARRHTSSTRAQAAPCSPAADTSPAQQGMDRRSLLLGVLVGTQALQLPTLQQALADSAPEITTVFVAGATGRTGRRVVQQLRAAGYKVRAGVRDVRKAQSLGFALDDGISIVEADVTKGPSVLENAIGDAQAVICATGATGFTGANSAAAVDEKGTISLVDAAKAKGVKAFVLQSSLLTNAVAVGQGGNSNYKVLNLFGGVLDRKLVAEKYLRSSGLRYTIVRPGGLEDKPASEVGALIVSGEDTLFGLDNEPSRVVSRDTVAEVMVAALRQPAAADRVVEIVASPSAPQLSEDKYFQV